MESTSRYCENIFFVGGMPEAVKRFMETNDSNQVRSVRNGSLYTYQKDISKHVPTSESNRINMVWHSKLRSMINLMLNNNMSISKIVQATGLTQEQIENLKG